MCPPLRRRNSSGEEEAIWKSPQSRKAENGAGETALNWSNKSQPGREMVAARPRTLAELGRVKGVGESKLKKYGPQLLESLAQVFTSGPRGPERAPQSGHPEVVRSLAFPEPVRRK